MLRNIVAIAMFCLLNANSAFASANEAQNGSDAARICQQLAAYRAECINALDERGVLDHIPTGSTLLLRIDSEGKVIETRFSDGESQSGDEAFLHRALKLRLPLCEALPSGIAVAIMVDRDDKLRKLSPPAGSDVVVAAATVGALECGCADYRSAKPITISNGTYYVFRHRLVVKTSSSSQGIVFTPSFFATVSSDSAGAFETDYGVYLKSGEIKIATEKPGRRVRVCAGTLRLGLVSASTVFVRSGQAAEILVAQGDVSVCDIQPWTGTSVILKLNGGVQILTQTCWTISC